MTAIGVGLTCTLCSMLSFGFAVTTLIELIRAKHLHVPRVEQTLVLITSVVYLLSSIFSMFGVTGAITRKRRIVLISKILLTISDVIMLIITAIALDLVLRHSDNHITCLQGFPNACVTIPPKLLRIIFAIILSIFVLYILATVLAFRLDKQLRNEQRFDQTATYGNAFDMKSRSASYYAYQLQDDAQARQSLLQPQGGHYRDHSQTSSNALTAVHVS